MVSGLVFAAAALLARLQDAPGGAQTSWDAGVPGWLEALERIGPWALLVLLAAMLARALWLQRRFKARGTLGDGDVAAVHGALEEVERRTVGEVVPVVLERSDRHPGACWLSALTALVVGTLLLEGPLFDRGAPTLLAAQLGLGALGYAAAALLPAWKRAFVSERRATEMAEEQAFQEFYALGLQRTEARTGVLIFVSLLEKRVVVLADEGIAAKVDPELWTRVDESILAGIVKGSLKDGLVEGIHACGAVLAEHFPVTDDDWNEVPDRLVVRKE